MTRQPPAGGWRYEIVSGTHGIAAWVELREQYYDDNGEKFGFNHIASAATIEELIADLREWLTVAEAYQERERD